MKISFSSSTALRAGAVVVGVLDDGVLSPSAERLDKTTGGALTNAIKSSRFKGQKGQTLAILAPSGLNVSRVVLAGMGKGADFDDLAAQTVGGNVCAALSGSGDSQATVMVDPVKGSKLAEADIAANIGYGVLLRSYRFDKYRTKEKPDQKPSLKNVTVATKREADAKKSFGVLSKIAEGVFFTRNLVSEPANVIYPVTLAAEAKKLAKLGVVIDVLDRKQMEKLGMGALLGVAQGSANEPRLVTMHWKGAGKANTPTAAFVGKGVTFDTGGISIKPSGGMEDMKWDMGGSGVVIGLMHALAARKAKANVVGVVGLVENMPSSTAQRPGDVVKTMSGQTAEVINTDAEGRLVLADAMWYCQEKFKPATMIDLATLTGAIIVSLGSEHAGLFANDDTLSDQLSASGKAVDELVWRMPMGDSYDKDINSDIADMKNVGAGRSAGSIAAAQFLKRFVKNGTAWAHIDIAGVTWSKKDKPTVPKGGTAFGVRLLDRWVADNCEDG